MREHKQSWLDIFQGFRIALDARKIILGTLGVYVTVLVLLGMLALAAHWWPEAHTFMENILRQPVATIVSVVGPSMENLLRHPVDTICDVSDAAMARMMPDPDGMGRSACWGLRELAFFSAGGVLFLFIWSFFGGAMTRIAAVDFAKGERPEIGEATNFTARKFGSFFWAPVVPFIFVAILVLCIMLLGLVGRIPVAGPVLVGIFFFLAMVASFLSLILLIGVFFGFPFMWPTIAMEGTDAFDAISRAYNYLFARPWKAIWCWLVALVYGIVVTLFVTVFTFKMLAFALMGVGHGMGADFGPLADLLRTGVVVPGTPISTVIGMLLVRVLILMTWGLVLGFIASYKLTAWTIIYAILRRDVDGTDMGEVYMPEPEEPPAEPKTEAKAEATPPPEQTPQT